MVDVALCRTRACPGTSQNLPQGPETPKPARGGLRKCGFQRAMAAFPASDGHASHTCRRLRASAVTSFQHKLATLARFRHKLATLANLRKLLSRRRFSGERFATFQLRDNRTNLKHGGRVIGRLTGRHHAPPPWHLRTSPPQSDREGQGRPYAGTSSSTCPWPLTLNRTG